MNNPKLFGFLSVYGLLIAVAMFIGIVLCSREEKRLGLPKDTALDFALWAIPSAIIGARLYYVAFRWDMYSGNLLSILYVWEGGLAIYGGVIAGAIATFVMTRVKKISFAKVADMAAPSLILAQAIGRWGNYFNGEAYGEIITDPALQFFPVAVFADNAWHMATFFYESMWDLIVFGILYLTRKRVTKDGNLFLLYMLLYGIGRAVVEGLRTDSLMLGDFRVSQLLSIAIAAAALIILAIRKAQKTTPRS